MSPKVEARLPGIVICVLGGVFCAGALSYGVVSGGRMGPGLMPMVAGLGLVVMGAALTVSTGRTAGEAGASDSDVATGADGTARSQTTNTDELGGGDARGAVAPSEGEAVETEADQVAVLAQEVHHPRRPWVILGTTVAGLLAAPHLGLIPALALMVFVILRFVERESWRISVGVTVALLLFGWFVFEKFLAVNLPWGVFGGLT